jgi:methyl-accepting chemotaxis protein
VTRGRITLEALFDSSYVPIAGTDPVQYRPFARPARRGFAAAAGPAARGQRRHNALLGDRPQWLCRSTAPATRCPSGPATSPGTRPTAATDASTTIRRGARPYLIQEYLIEHSTTLVRSISAPIRVFGKHWGAVRINYRLAGSKAAAA